MQYSNNSTRQARLALTSYDCPRIKTTDNGMKTVKHIITKYEIWVSEASSEKSGKLHVIYTELVSVNGTEIYISG